MNTLENILQKDLIEAMKNKNESRMSAIRSVKTAIMETRTAVGGKKDLTDGDIIKIIQKQIKQREESISIYEQAGRAEAAEKETSEMMWLNIYVPKTFDENQTQAAVNKAIDETGATSMKDMGRVMKFLTDTYGSQIDRGFASKFVKEKLS